MTTYSRGVVLFRHLNDDLLKCMSTYLCGLAASLAGVRVLQCAKLDLFFVFVLPLEVTFHGKCVAILKDIPET